MANTKRCMDGGRWIGIAIHSRREHGTTVRRQRWRPRNVRQFPSGRRSVRLIGQICNRLQRASGRFGFGTASVRRLARTCVCARERPRGQERERERMLENERGRMSRTKRVDAEREWQGDEQIQGEKLRGRETAREIDRKRWKQIGR